MTVIVRNKKMSDPDSNVAYENLKKNIIKKSENSLDLEKVKEYFSGIIISRRALSQVKNLNDIFYLLQRRDVLGYDNVSILEYLADLLQNEDIGKLVKGYKKLYIDSEEIACNCGDYLSFTLPVISTESTSIEKERLDDLQCAFNNIAMTIGKNWRVLASELKVPEFYVDEVREKYPSDFYQQALNILQIWRKYNEDKATIETLKMALDARLCKMKGLGLHMLKPVITV